MEPKDIVFRYATHYEAIQKIGEYPLAKSLQLSDLGDTKEMKSVAQKCYNDMHKDNYDVTVIDYLCIISTLYVINEVNKRQKDIQQVDYATNIVKMYFISQSEIRNLLRYFMKNPFLFLNITRNEKQEGNADKLKCFHILGGLWFTIMELEMLRSIYKGKDKLRGKMEEEFWLIQKEKGFLFRINNGEYL
jgi:hypothetical protein